MNLDEDCLRRKRKPKAWCGDCFQSFEYGPNAKICKDHLFKGKCNLIECRKKSLSCVRKFPNTNSENRHTYCITRLEVDKWDGRSKLQEGVGKKQNDDFVFNISPLKDASNNTPPKSNNLSGLINTLDNLGFEEEELFDEDDLLGQFNKVCFNDKGKLVMLESKGTQTDGYRNADFYDEDIDIDCLFERIQSGTKIPKGILKKLKSAFKRKGIFTSKILKLMIRSNKTWTEDFKKSCPQIEGVSLYIENLLN
jgi:hypothetical protein